MKEDSPNVPEWLYDELTSTGVDYSDPSVAEDYDAQHGRFRDFEKDARLIVDRVGIEPGDTVIDLGSGTGAFVLSAARLCKQVHAVDVSPAMLKRLEEKARLAGLDNVDTHRAGFLTYDHRDAPADVAVTVAALHHLPDFWKGVALKRLRAMLKPGGRLYLFDVVFGFALNDYQAELGGWVDGIRQGAGKSMADETVVHIRDEFSTFDWVLEGLLERAGFRIDRTFSDFPLTKAYLCTAISDN